MSPEASPPGFEPGLARLELAVLPLHHGLVHRVKRTARVERASPEWRSGALPAELRSHEICPAGIEPAFSAVPGRRSSPLSYGHVFRARSRAFVKILLHKRGGACGPAEPPAGVEPAPRPYKGRVLAVDTTEAWAPADREWRRPE